MNPGVTEMYSENPPVSGGWYYQSKEGSCGPYLTSEIRELIRQGQIRSMTLMRHESEPRWTPADQFSGVFAFGAAHAPVVRPWSRYWARDLDVMVWSTLWASAAAALNLELPQAMGSGLILIAVTALLWLPAEILLMSTLGTTPGKLIFGIRVRTADGRKPSLRQAARRSLLVLWRGQALGIPVLSMLTMLNGHHTLHAEGQTTWDRDSGLLTSYRPRGWASHLFLYTVIALLLYYRVFSMLT